MWRHCALAALAIALQNLGTGAGARADEKIPCDAFVKLGDGSWQAVTKTFIPGPDFNVREGSLWRPGATVMGVDVASTLDKECPNAPVAQPAGAAVPAVPGQAQQPQISQAPQVSLSRFADANGNIDVSRLTCAHLADASPQETDMLLAWYSGWYNGLAKGRGVNLARVRYAMHSVTDYCKANPDKRLSQVMDLMLK